MATKQIKKSESPKDRKLDDQQLPDFPTSGLSASPKSQGYYFPAEFAPHEATWLSWPHKEESWPGKIHTIYSSYLTFVKELTKGELVRINVADQRMLDFASTLLSNAEVNLNKVQFYMHPTNDAWCRDHVRLF